MFRPNVSRNMLLFALYDWANSAYSTLSITVLVTYLQSAVLPGPAGEIAWGWGVGCTMFVAALLSPILGAMADASANKRTWLTGTTLTGSVAAMLMFFATPDRPWLLVGLFLITSLGFELSQGFYNAFLPEIATDEQMGRVSAWSYGAGYVGGGIALAIAFGLFLHGDKLGLPTANHFLPRFCLLLMGLWWLGFSLPTLIGLRDKGVPRVEPRRFSAAARVALGEVRRTLTRIRQFRMLAIFLLGFLIFNDGVQTVISQASVFGVKVLKMETPELLQVILMIQFVALPGALAVGWLADRIGQKRALVACLGVWILLLSCAFFVETRGQFWGMAVVVALVLGGTQSVSRTIMGQMTPERHAAEFFGFFNLSGKATSMFGPVLFSTILASTGSAHLAIVSLLVFFIAGTLIVLPLDVTRGRREARHP